MSAAKFKEIMSKGAETPAPEQAKAKTQEAPENAKTEAQKAPEPATRKFGEGHAMGMLRLGGHEITQALQAFPDSNIRPIEEPGVVGNGNVPQRVIPNEKSVGGDNRANDKADQKDPVKDEVVKEPAKEFSLKDILEAPSTPVQAQEHVRGGREM